MKKSLIALAVLGAFSGAALADGSNVQVYGLLDEGFQHFDNGTISSNQLTSGEAAVSRFGFKGTEDLGNGLSSTFQLEEGLSPVNGLVAGATSQPRVADITLSGAFGTILAGRTATWDHMDLYAVDPFKEGMTGNADQIGGAGTLNALDPVTRATVLAYVTPSFSGLTLSAVWTTGADVAATTAGGWPTTGAYAVHAGYTQGPLFGNFDYLIVDDKNSAKAVDKWSLGGGYDFGVAKVTGIYGDNKPDAINGINNGHENTAWLLGVTVPVGAGNILASYAEGKDKTANTQGKQYAIGYEYSLSKRTQLYTSYGHMANDGAYNGAILGANGNDGLATPATGASSSGFDLGMIVSF